jgi:hypothetical protein
MYQKINNYIKSYLLRWYYHFTNLYSKKQLNKEDQNIMISLTTFTQRIDVVYLTIESLFMQNQSIGKICLWLSEDEFPDMVLPKTLQRLQKRGLEIYFAKGNTRSYKKLIYSLQLFPEYTIITVDDDIYYPKDWFSDMVQAHKEFPNFILCGRGHYLRKGTADELLPYLEMVNKTPKGQLKGLNFMPTGVSGVLYPPNSLDPQVLDVKLFTELAPYADDVWFKACSLLTRTPVLRIYENNRRFLGIRGMGESGLAQKNVGENKNDEQLKAVFDHFDLYSYIE